MSIILSHRVGLRNQKFVETSESEDSNRFSTGIEFKENSEN